MSSEKVEIARSSLVDQDSPEPGVSLSRYVMRNVMRSVELDGERMDHWSLPAAQFSGDVFSAVMTAGDRLTIILADGTGHGLGTALCMMPISDIFYTMASKGFPISIIAKELNQKMERLLPEDRFIRVILTSISWGEKKIEVWNGGAPPSFFLNKAGEFLKFWKSRHLPVGILSTPDFDDSVESYQWENPGQFFIHTDGLTTAKNGKDESFGTERMHRILSDSIPEVRFQNLRTAVIDHIGVWEAGDDLSLISINCDPECLPKTEMKEQISQEKAYAPSAWKLSLHLNETDMKNIDVLPVLLTWFKQVGIDQKDTQRLFLILSELYTNALDHGLLHLDSSLKDTSSGFDEYMDQRGQRMNHLEDAKIDIFLERVSQLEGNLLKIRLEDSGKGFDFTRHIQGFEKGDDENILNLYGKGIELVSRMAQNMHYSNQGNVIELEYVISN